MTEITGRGTTEVVGVNMSTTAPFFAFYLEMSQEHSLKEGQFIIVSKSDDKWIINWLKEDSLKVLKQIHTFMRGGVWCSQYKGMLGLLNFNFNEYQFAFYDLYSSQKLKITVDGRIYKFLSNYQSIASLEYQPSGIVIDAGGLDIHMIRLKYSFVEGEVHLEMTGNPLTFKKPKQSSQSKCSFT